MKPVLLFLLFCGSLLHISSQVESFSFTGISAIPGNLTKLFCILLNDESLALAGRVSIKTFTPVNLAPSGVSAEPLLGDG